MDIPTFQIDTDSTEDHAYVLCIPSGMQLRETISFAVPHGAFVRIVAQADSQAAVSLVTEGDMTIEVVVENDATVSVVTLQTANGVIRQSSKVHSGATVHFQNISLAQEVDHQLCSHLVGAHAVSNVDWIFYAKDTEKHRVSARNVFEANNGGGEIVMKGVAQDSASVFCDGMIEIGLQGGGTDTYLTENVLMLDTTARIDAIPGLEIKTNDVKASHSATVSKVTAEDLFYFASRGIDESIARHMYVQGFLGELTAKIEDSALQESLRETIEKKFQ